MRITINIDEHLRAEAKEVAARSGRTLDAVVEDALRAARARRDEQRRRGPLKLPTFRGGHLQPGVDLDNSAALPELMEEADGR